ncbi:DUF6167 family protein [Streptomyces sp. 891-h]|uniref:DUF6167 family protein n=1 Tax=unclassified Streptomyces TaxID=2593676 RepID=UPI001FAAC5F0|nr:DUF6167 family protein [Streptomyces sp. 891-h]UNZ20383.1 hypothetical protein HC362_28315 [Streptomyces sp. 891-h]
MFRRAFWFTTGAAAGVWATTKVQRKIRSLAPDALALRAADKAVEGGNRLREFALDVRAGMVQRESELKDALGLSAGEADRFRELPAAQPASVASQRGKPLPRQQRKRQLGGAPRPEAGRNPQAPPRDPDRLDRQDQPSTPNHPNDRNEDH